VRINRKLFKLLPGDILKVFLNDELFVEAERADSFLEHLKGLMFNEINKDEGLLLAFEKNRKWSIWMLFVPQDLALFFLDDEGRVVDKKIAEKLTWNPKTWNVYKPAKRCKYVLECHKERINDLEINERLEWKNG